MRAWARSNGYDVADRGRLPAEVTEAYLAAHPGGSGRTTATKSKPAAAKKSAGRKPAAKKAATKKAAAKPAKKAPSSTESAAPAKQSDAQAAPAAKADPAPKPSPVSDDRRLVALGEQIAALTKRVEALESAGGTKSSGKNGSKSSRFRRSR